MKATRQIDIYITKKSNVRLIDVVQFDTGIHLVFTVKDFDIPSGATAKLYVQKPSGKFVFQEDGITIVENTILIDLENQAITEHGKVPYQVSIVNGSDMITAFTGLMMVEKSLKDAGAIESKTVIRAFDEVVSDHVAEFQAKAEQIVQACIATIPEDFTVMEAKVNELANAVKGYVSGAVVVADDVSPVEHSPVVKVHGKNLIPYPYSEQSITRDGVSFTVNEDGGISLSGTATINTSFNLVMQYKKSLQVKKGRKYTLSCVSTFTAATGYVYFQNWANGVGVDSLSVRNGSVTFEASQDGYVQIGIVLLKGQTYNETVYIQLEEGSVATGYVPYLDPSKVLVSRYSKNILNIANSSKANCTANGNGITVNAAGVYYCELYANYLKSAIQNMDGKAVTFSVGNITSGYFIAIVIMYTDGTYAQKTAYDTKATLWLDHQGRTVHHVILRPFCSKTTFTDTTTDIKNLMLEFGETASDFEAYNGGGYTPAADGTVAGVTSLSPTMTLLTDTAGAIVECEYAVDTKTYIDRKISEMLKGSENT